MSEPYFREYWRILQKHRYIILGITLVCSLFALFYALLATPIFEATAKIKIGTYQPVLTATKIEDLLQEKSKEANYLETQLEELTSMSLADRVIQDPEVRAALNTKERVSFWAGIFGDGKSAEDNEPLGAMSSTSKDYQSSLMQLQSYNSRIKIRPIRRTSNSTLNCFFKKPC